MVPAILKTQAGTRDEVAHGARDERFPRIGLRRDACRDVNGNSHDIVPLQLDFASMEAATHRYAERPHRLRNCDGTTHRPCWAVERREKAVAEALDLLAAEAGKLLPHGLVVSPD